MNKRGFIRWLHTSALVLMASTIVTTNVQAAAVLVIDPATQNAAPGDSVGVDVFVFNDQPLGLGSFGVDYDDTRLHFAGFTPNIAAIFDPAIATAPPTVTESPTDGQPGHVSPLSLFAATSAGFGNGPSSWLGTLGFDVLATAPAGSAPLSLVNTDSTLPFFTESDTLTATFTNPVAADFSAAAGAIVVTPIPAAGWLMFSALVVFTLISLRRSTLRPGSEGEETTGYSLS